MRVCLSIAVLSIVFACIGQEKELQFKIKNGIIKVYREDKIRLHKELSYKNDKLDGLSKIYHPMLNCISVRLYQF
jgi:antitoxin component YwqK of YwqJK toxin-antitoxin module